MEKGTNFKYIVYSTKNKVNGKIYIGVHKTKDPDNFDGYIGCGIYINQPNTYSKPKTNFQYAVKKYGTAEFERTTLAVFNTPEEAYQLEADLVNEEFLSREDVYNMCLGGEFSIGENNKIKVYCYTLKGSYVDEFNSFAEAALVYNVDPSAISYAVRNKEKSSGMYWSTDKLTQLDLSLYSVINNSRKKVSVYTLDGILYKTFDTQVSASKELDISQSGIVKAVKLGTKIKGYYFSTQECESFDKARTKQISIRPVYKYSKEGDFIEAFKSQKDAELIHPYSNITKAIKMKSVCENGFMWALEELKNYNKPKSGRGNKRPVGKFTLDGELIKEYDSATSAEKENGTCVWKVLSGKSKTHKSHIYKYLDN